MIWAMPARRPGAWLQKSASQRLWAWSPAQRRSRSPSVAPGGWCTSDTLGKNGGFVLGKMPSATTPSASISRRRRSELQLRSASAPVVSWYGFSKAAAQRSKSPWYCVARKGLYPPMLAPPWQSDEITAYRSVVAPMSGSLRSAAVAGPAAPAYDVDERPERVGVEGPGVGDVASLGLVRDQLRPSRRAQREVAGDRVPGTVPQDQLAVDVLDLALLEGGGDVDDVGREVVGALGAPDRPRVLGPPLVLDEVAVAGRGLAGHRAPELYERVALVAGARRDPVTEAEVRDVAEELGLPVGLAADVDGGLLVDAEAESVLAGHALPGGLDLDAHA